MCMTDDAERVTKVSAAYRTARKPHRCAECGRAIEPGESYHYETFVFDGKFTSHKTCKHCMVARQWLSDECGGWVYGAVQEDIDEHAAYEGYGFRVRLLAAGMARKWKRKDGRMWPVPKVPPTAHELLAASTP